MADFEENDKPQGIPAEPKDPNSTSPHYNSVDPNSNTYGAPQSTDDKVTPPENTTYYQYNEVSSSPPNSPTSNDNSNMNSYNNYQQPNGQQPYYQQPNGEQPYYQQPNGQPYYQQPNDQQPYYQQPNGEQPNYQQPNGQPLNGEQPNYQQPNGQPYYQQPNGEQPNNQSYAPYSYMNTNEQPANPSMYNNTQNMANEAYIPGVGVPPVSKQKKKFPKLILAVILALCLLIGAGALAVNKIPSLSNTFALTTMKPGGYYAKVEQTCVTGGITNFSESYGNLLAQYKSKDKKGVAQNVDIKFTLGDTYSKAITQMDFKSLEAKISSMSNPDAGKIDIELLANGSSFATVNSFFDFAKPEGYIKIPELSDSYLKLNSSLFSADSSSLYSSFLEGSASSESLQNLFKNQSLSEKELNRILNRYSKLITKELGKVKDIKLSKSQTIKANKIEEKATKVTIKLSAKDLQPIVLSILNTAKEDKDIQKLCVDLEFCTEDTYKSYVEIAIASIKSPENEISDDKIAEMNIWTNSKGEVIGREITITSDSVVTFGYTTATKGDSMGFEAWVSNDSVEQLSLLGKIDTLGTKKSGTFTLNLSAEATSSKDISFQVNMEDYETVPQREGAFNGIFKITCDALTDYSLTIDAKGNEKSQSVAFKVSDKAGEVGTLSINAKDGTYAEFKLPSNSEKMYDIETEMEAYLAGADTQGFITNVNTILNVEDITTAISQLISGSSAIDDDIIETPDVIDPLPTIDPTVVATPDPNAVATPDPNASSGEEKVVDANGDYYYEPDYQTILAAGVGSTSGHYNMSGTQVKDSLTTLVAQLYPSVLTMGKEEMNNKISGHVDEDPDYSYEYTYFENISYWTNAEEYNLFISYTRDSVTDQPISFYLSEVNKVRGEASALAILSLVEGEISEENRALILNGLTIPAGESLASYEYGNSDITAYSSDGTYISFSISAKKQY